MRNQAPRAMSKRPRAVRFAATVHAQTIEGFWSLMKRSVRGTHVHVSHKHLSKYLSEFEFRWSALLQG
jgi:ISXO2-like transposase domain